MANALTAVFGADSDPFIQELRRAQKEFEKWGSDFSHSLDGVRGAADALSTLFGVSLGGGIAAFTKQTIENISALQDQADALNLNVEQYQAYRFAAGQAGIDNDKFTTGLGFMNRVFSDAKTGVQSALDTFTKWRVNISQARDSADVLQLLADRFQSLSGAQQGSFLQDFFSKQGLAFSNFLRDGSAGLADMEAKARAAGAVIDEEIVKKGKIAGDQLRAMGDVITSQLSVALVNILGDMKQFGSLANLMTDSIKGFAQVTDMLFNDIQHQSHDTLVNELTMAQNLLKTLQSHQGNSFQTLLDGGATTQAAGIKNQQDRIQQITAALDALNNKPKPTPPPAGGGIDTVTASKHALDDYLTSLQHENDLLQLNGVARKQQEELFKAEEAASKDGKVLTEEQIQTVLGLAAADYKLTEAEKAAKDQMQEMKQFANQLAASMNSAFEDAIKGGKSFSDTLKALGLDILNLIQKFLIFQPLAKGIGSLFGDTGGAGGGGFSLDSLFGGSSTTSLSDGRTITWNGARSDSLFGGVGNFFSGIGDFLGFADGGRPPPGVPSIVGERGPELFIPDSPGRIVPSGSSMGGGPTIYADLRGADVAAVMRLENMIQSVNAKVESWAAPGNFEARMQTAMSRGYVSTR